MTEQHSHIPAFVAKARLAYELDISESTVDEFVRRAILPPPMKFSSGCVRWAWTDVVNHIDAFRNSGSKPGDDDPYIVAARKVSQNVGRGRRRDE